MRRLLLGGPAILVVLGCESGPRKPPEGERQGPGASSLAELRELTLRAIREDDIKEYLELVASPAFLLKHCAEEPKYGALAEGGAVAARDLQRDEVRRALAVCTEVDWSRATLDRDEGGAAKPSSGLECSPPSEAFGDLISLFRVGDTTWRVKAANDVYRVAGRYLALDSPKCERDDL